MKKGFIKQYRRELDSDVWLMPPLYGRVWRWLLLKAKWKKEIFPTPRRFGIHLNPGQLITSIDLIAQGVQWLEWGKEKKPNKKTIKTIIDWLKGNDMIGVESNATGTFIYIINWDKYNTKEDEKVTESSQELVTEKKRLLDTIKELQKKLKEFKKEKKHNGRFSASVYLSEKGIKKQHIEEFLKVRRTKKLAATETAFERLGNEFEKAKLNWNDGIEKCIENSWGGFKASWINGEKKSDEIEDGYRSPEHIAEIKRLRRLQNGNQF